MYTLGSVKLAGFRGVTQDQEVSFDSPVTILFGENHQGKSSILNAIEWCLYGDDCKGADTGMRERVDWEVISRRADAAEVRVNLRDNGGEVVVLHKETRARRSQHKLRCLRLPDGSEFTGDECDRELSGRLRCEFRDFMATAYQHQEAVRAVITQAPKDRNDAIDRLLGLSDYRHIREALKKSLAPSIQKTIRDEFANFVETRVGDALRTRERDLATAEARLSSFNILEEEARPERALGMSVDISSGLRSFAKDLGMPEPALAVPDTWAGCRLFCDKARATARELLRKSPDSSVQQELIKRRTALVNSAAACEETRAALNAARGELDEFNAKSGTRQGLQARAAELTGEIDGLTNQIVQESRRRELIRQGMGYLQEAGQPPAEQVCPLCGSPVRDLLAHLREEWDRTQTVTIAGLEAKREQKETEKTRINDSLSRLGDLEQGLRRAANGLGEASRKAAAALGREVAQDEDPAALARRESEELERRLAQLEELIGQRQQRVAAIEASLDGLLALCDVLQAQEKKDQVEHIRESDEFRQIQALRDEVAKSVADLQAIERATADAANEEAEAKVGSAQEELDRHFRAMTQNPAVTRVQIKVEQGKTGNDYRILDQDERDLSPVLSQGDMNCLALALFMGLGQAASDTAPFGFMIFDDPSQSLGTEEKSRFVERLNDVATSKQLVISTMDAELKDLLQKNLTKAKTCYVFSDWSPETGPRISRT
jgi:DNA repair exonuclease SbcCD ATPase subunit